MVPASRFLVDFIRKGGCTAGELFACNVLRR